jgi:hypothetical protein
MGTQKCPTCDSGIEVGRNLGGKIASEGDFNICRRCGAFLTYLNTGKVRAFDKEELRRLKADDPAVYAWLDEQRLFMFPGFKI